MLCPRPRLFMARYYERPSTLLAQYAMSTGCLLGAMYICIVARAIGLTQEKDGLALYLSPFFSGRACGHGLPLMATS
jgi:hypothetical protein